MFVCFRLLFYFCFVLCLFRFVLLFRVIGLLRERGKVSRHHLRNYRGIHSNYDLWTNSSECCFAHDTCCFFIGCTINMSVLIYSVCHKNRSYISARLQATFKGAAGRIWLAGRHLRRPDLSILESKLSSQFHFG